jgi:hypothetical protein
MYKQILVTCLLLLSVDLKVNARDKSDILIGEIKSQLGQKRGVLYNPEVAENTLAFANYFCDYYGMYREAYSSIDEPVNKQDVKKDILKDIDRQLEGDEHLAYIDRWNLEFYDKVMDSIFITNYCQ